MPLTLCETFRFLAFRTHAQMGNARHVGHQPLEETFTDTNILELKVRHPTQLYSRTFNKREEGISGADWEWWLTNSTKSNWLGLRVQAKILNCATDTFPHLHYRSGKARGYQILKLRRECVRDGLIPLYCFYTHFPPNSRLLLRYRRYRYTVESYGCAIASLARVDALRKAGEIDDAPSVLRGALPWHLLVCDEDYNEADLPTIAWMFLQAFLKVKQPSPRSVQTDYRKGRQPVGLRRRPPAYVYAVMEGQEPDIPPASSRGLLVIVGKNDQQRWRIPAVGAMSLAVHDPRGDRRKMLRVSTGCLLWSPAPRHRAKLSFRGNANPQAPVPKAESEE